MQTTAKPAGAPLFLEKLSPVQVTEGESFSMTTRVTLDEEGHLPLIEWFKDGKRIDSDRCHRKILANGVLTLCVEESKPQDAGSYLVRASNADGEAESSAPVTVVCRLPTYVCLAFGYTISANFCLCASSVVSLPRRLRATTPSLSAYKREFPPDCRVYDTRVTSITLRWHAIPC